MILFLATSVYFPPSFNWSRVTHTTMYTDNHEFADISNDPKNITTKRRIQNKYVLKHQLYL